ncbi:MAG: gluconate 2-dehydrogenase subunit 3 family protein [Chitinophagales bacterium]
MDRRKSIKTLLIGSASAGMVVEACKLSDKKPEEPSQKKEGGPTETINRMPEEKAHFEEVMSEKFFTQEEILTLTLLGDIIIPRDEVSGSASDAKVPEFLEFIVKDMANFQTPLRGGIRWLDLECLHAYGKSFKDCTHEQQMEMVDNIAWPKRKLKPGMEQGVAFFSLVRNLVATGFYTTEMGIKDVGYIGNQPNQWNGVPEDVLKQYHLAYSEKELKECVSFS